MTVNGKTMAENLKDVPGISELGAQVIQGFMAWFNKSGNNRKLPS